MRRSSSEVGGAQSGGAYVDAKLRVQGSLTGPLQGSTFAVKNLFDVSMDEIGSRCLFISYKAPVYMLILASVSNSSYTRMQIKGHHTGFGNPTWLETHPPAEETAPCIQMLLDAGASIR